MPVSLDRDNLTGIFIRHFSNNFTVRGCLFFAHSGFLHLRDSKIFIPTDAGILRGIFRNRFFCLRIFDSPVQPSAFHSQPPQHLFYHTADWLLLPSHPVLLLHLHLKMRIRRLLASLSFLLYLYFPAVHQYMPPHRSASGESKYHPNSLFCHTIHFTDSSLMSHEIS